MATAPAVSSHVVVGAIVTHATGSLHASPLHPSPPRSPPRTHTAASTQRLSPSSSLTKSATITQQPSYTHADETEARSLEATSVGMGPTQLGQAAAAATHAPHAEASLASVRHSQAHSHGHTHSHTHSHGHSQTSVSHRYPAFMTSPPPQARPVQAAHSPLFRPRQRTSAGGAATVMQQVLAAAPDVAAAVVQVSFPPKSFRPHFRAVSVLPIAHYAVAASLARSTCKRSRMVGCHSCVCSGVLHLAGQ